MKLTPDRLEFLKSDYERGFIKYCGFQVVKIAEGFLEALVTITENHKTQDNFVHAGVIATMADHTAGYAAYTLVSEQIRILTVEFKINFFKPAYGSALRCRSEILNHGRQIIVAQSTVYDIRGEEEKMVAKSTITLMALDHDHLAPKNPSGEASIPSGST
jgi:uncharacterized protein (TIGR00369 family)